MIVHVFNLFARGHNQSDVKFALSESKNEMEIHIVMQRNAM